MKLQTSIFIHIVGLLMFMIFALSASFYFIYSADIEQRAKQHIEETFSLLKKHISIQRETISNEINEVNDSLKNILNQIYAYETIASQNHKKPLENLKSLLPILSPAIDEIFKLSKSLGQENVQIAIYKQNGDLLFVYHIKNLSEQSVSFYYPQINTKKLIVLRQKKILPWVQQTKVVLSEQRVAFLENLDDLETIELPKEIALHIDPNLIQSAPSNSFKVIDDVPAISYQTPIHGAQQINTYFAPIEESSLTKEPNNGFIDVSLQFNEGNLEKIAAITNTQVNAFVNNIFSVGTLHTYANISQQDTPALSFDIFTSNPKVASIIETRVQN